MINNKTNDKSYANKSLQPLLYDKSLSPVFNHSFTSMIVTDTDGHINWVNMACEQLLNTSAKQLVGLSIYDILLPSKKDNGINSLKTDSIQAQFDKAKNSFQAFVSYDRWITAIKQSLFVDYSVTPTLNENKTEFLIEIWSKDRHHRISQEHLDQQQYDIARNMLRSVAHEVKNPLAGIRGAAQLLERQLKKLQIHDDKIQTYANIVINETDRLNQLIKQILGSQQQPNWQSMNVHIPLEHVLTLAHSQNPDLKIIKDYDLSLPDVIADKDLLIQAFLNLTTNAIEAMQQKQVELQMAKETLDNTTEYQPKLTISTRVEFQYTVGNTKHKQVAKISLTDNGNGIDDALLNKIFFPLVTGRAEGTGLGLSIVQNIIQQHHGQVEVQSAKGKTTFSIYLPFSHPTPKNDPTKHLNTLP